jgi:hypothetical protein
MTWTLIDTGGGYHPRTSEQPRPSPHPSLPSGPLSPICLARSQQQYITTNIASTDHNEDILLVHEKVGPTCEWDLPLDFYRWLSTKQSTSSHIKVIHL